MKTLFLHLSDAHFKSDTFYSEKIVNSQVQALSSVGDFNACFIMFSGDLSFSGQKNEYRKAFSYIKKLHNAISSKYQLDYYVTTLIVPGNHDINFEGNRRDRSEIRKMLNEEKGGLSPGISRYHEGTGRSHPPGDLKSAEAGQAFRWGDRGAFPGDGGVHLPAFVCAQRGRPDPGYPGGKVHLLPTQCLGA